MTALDVILWAIMLTAAWVAFGTVVLGLVTALSGSDYPEILLKLSFIDRIIVALTWPLFLIFYWLRG